MYARLSVSLENFELFNLRGRKCPPCSLLENFVDSFVSECYFKTTEKRGNVGLLSTTSLRSKRFRGAKSEEETGLSAFCPREKWGESKNKKEGVGEGKEGLVTTPSHCTPTADSVRWLSQSDYSICITIW